jgi:predicted nucleic-acid-binding protein
VIYIDTNVFVRLLVQDDDAMTALARRFVEQNKCCVAKTVVLETSWVLASNFGFGTADILRAFEMALGLTELEFEEGHAIVNALGWAKAGLEFEDAFHLACVPATAELATFDKAFAARSERQKIPVPVRLLRVKP